jgi:ubiquinone/menaquinone biosynthesis C-methylase UbiE
MSDRPQRETYTHSYSHEYQQYHGSRTAAHDAAFLVPRLRSGMRLLDCGCGPGSITWDLAALVAPGEVIGIDLADAQLAAARRLAARRGLSNTRFETGDVYALPFPDASFDAAFASHVLQHLREPLKAMKEMRRVLKPGRVAGNSDNDLRASLYEPATPLRKTALELVDRVIQHNGGSIFYARHQRGLLREAGFVDVEGHAVAEVYGTPAKTRVIAAAGIQQLRDPEFVATVLAQGWADRATLEAMVVDIQAWEEEPDAYYALLNPAVVGWVPDNE